MGAAGVASTCLHLIVTKIEISKHKSGRETQFLRPLPKSRAGTPRLRRRRCGIPRYVYARDLNKRRPVRCKLDVPLRVIPSQGMQ